MSMKNFLIDTHAHLDYFFKRGRIGEIIENARNAGVERIITCSAQVSDWEVYASLAEEHPDIISWQAGLHPTELDGDSETCIQALASNFISKIPPVAVGEIGLDFYRMPESLSEEEKEKYISRQTLVFKKQLEIASDLGVPVCVHARSSFRECIDAIKSVNFDFSKTVFHCFSGTPENLEELNSLGGRASFTGIITYKNAGEMRDAMLRQGLEKLMFETDCPYLAPHPMRGGENQPANIKIIAEFAAECFGISFEKIREISTANALDFFGI